MGPSLRQSRADWLTEALGELDALLSLEENWNSYGAAKIDPASVAHAKRWLEVISRVAAIERPTVTASPDGCAAFCWDDGQRSFDAEILPDGTMSYTYLNPASPTDDEDGVAREPGEITHLLSRS